MRATSPGHELVLRENLSYEFSRIHPESMCTETGTYKINNDTIYLHEDPFFDQTLFYNEVLLIERDSNLLIEIKRDTSEHIMKIEYFKD